MRLHVVRLVCSIITGFMLSGCGTDATAPVVEGPLPPGFSIKLETFTDRVPYAIALTQPLDDGRIFIADAAGKIHVMRNGQFLDAPFLDISADVLELLSIVFHPQYATNHFFYVYYRAPSNEIRVDRFTTSSNPELADPSSRKQIIGIPLPMYNPGGCVSFGPDGMMYISTGDGGQPETAQDTNSLLGSLLRIDVDHGDPYSIPPDNPFAGQLNRRGEIWAKGLENPYRFAFDAPTGRLYMPDQGHNDKQEVNVVDASQPALNYGWNIMEGKACYPDGASCDQTGLTLPVRTEGRYVVSTKIIGGYVYRGKALPELRGHYFHTDGVYNWYVESFWYNGTGVQSDPTLTEQFVTSFGTDIDGELYVLGTSIKKVVRGN